MVKKLVIGTKASLAAALTSMTGVVFSGDTKEPDKYPQIPSWKLKQQEDTNPVRKVLIKGPKMNRKARRRLDAICRSKKFLKGNIEQRMAMILGG